MGDYLLALINAGQVTVRASDVFTAGLAAGYKRPTLGSAVARTGLVVAVERISNKGGKRGSNDSLWHLAAPTTEAA